MAIFGRDSEGLSMRTWSIDVTRSIGGEAIRVPRLTLDNVMVARAKYREIVERERLEMNAPFMRDIGGTSEVFLIEGADLLGFGGDLVKSATIKRPLHSPSAMVCEH